jgi:signal peptidase I
MLHTTDYLYNLRRDWYGKARGVVFFVAAVVLVLYLVLRFVTHPVMVGSASMAPDLPEGNLVFVTPLAGPPTSPFALAGIDRGDVVLVKNRGALPVSPLLERLDAAVAFFTFHAYSVVNPRGLSSLSPTLSRVAALPGDRIFMKDNILYVRTPGAPAFVSEFELTSARYNTTTKPFPAHWDATIGVPANFAEFTLAPDEYFLLADERSSAFDSRIWGPVRGTDISGKVYLRYYPLSALKVY